MTALLHEFENLREATAEIDWCQKCWWENGSLQFLDWITLDSLYRSRCLELPTIGEALVPVLDMVNHSYEANAIYEQTSNKGVSLLLKPSIQLDQGSEITISYGDSKSEAEMLFSYGFLDGKSSVNVVVLPVDPFEDDPLGKAKIAAFGSAPTVRISSSQAGLIEWECPFLYLLSLNEEDGLEFKVLQENDGSQSALRVFWQEVDVTEKTKEFESLITSHEHHEVFKLRAVALLQNQIQQQIGRLYVSETAVNLLVDKSLVALDKREAALQ